MDGLRLFELLQELRPEKSAKAVLLEWDGEMYVPTSEKIEVYEFCAMHGHRGDRGYCFLSPASKRWEVVGGLFQQMANRGMY